MRSGMASEPRRDVPDVRYARSGDVNIAYHVVGGGGLDLVFAPGYVSHLTHALENPTVAGFFERLASLGRLIRFDRRGIGLSDRPRDVATLETRMDDIRAVMDATGSRRAALIATGDAGAMATLFAATYPERVAAVVLWSPYARGTAAVDYPIGETEAEWQRQLDEIEQGWGTRPFLEKQFAETGAGLSDYEALFEWFSEMLRCAASPGAALTVYRMAMEVDVRDVLPAIRVPVLILHRATTRMDAEFMTERIPGARCVEIAGRASIFGDGVEQTLSEIEQFLATATGKAEPETVLSTVLFTDIVGSTERAAELGDRPWRETLESHDAMIRRCLDLYRGRELDTAGDGFFASFDGPVRAIRCALAISQMVRELGLEVRAGLHTGVCEIRGDKISGLAVNLGARVAAMAAQGEVLVSSTVKDLVAGSGIEFEDRGEHELKGVPGEWRLYAVSSA
jgi:class 3 adenylate cyclase/alpha-beta hydrolase superfamily lysophospholipase